MENSFDLDVNNYTPKDLIKFFNLEPSYSLNDLLKKATEMAVEIQSPNNSAYNAKYKTDIIQFITSAKDILALFKKDVENTAEIKKNIDRVVNMHNDSRTGRIINPLDSHPALETFSIPTESINGYDYVANTSIYVFNTAGRNDYFVTESSSATFDLPLKWKNVISISLTSANIPNVMYAFNEESSTNQLYIEEDGTGLSGIVVLPPGNYTPFEIPASGILLLNDLIQASFPDELTKAINEQILGIFIPANYRFKVSIGLSNRVTTISNNTHTFTMNILRRKPRANCNVAKYSSTIYEEYDVDPPPNKTKIPFLVYVQTMGFLMGYRETYYTGQKSYISESVFSNTYSNYLFLELDDYTGSQPASSTYGILGNSVLNSNILGVIPINSALFSTTFDNNSNFIYKKREYYGPVDISRITVKLLNQKGNLVDLRKTDYSFSIQVRSLYNIKNTGKGIRTPGLF